MSVIFNQLIQNIKSSGDRLTDIMGHYLCFNDEKSSDMLVAISIIFHDKSMVIEAQEDDSFIFYNGKEWRSTEKLIDISIIDHQAWSAAKGKPLLWSWILVNQQGFLDGVQLEFAENISDDESVAIQFVALGSEIMFRQIFNNVEVIAPPQ